MNFRFRTESQGKSELVRPLGVPEHAKLGSTEGIPMWVWQDIPSRFSVNWPEPRLSQIATAVRNTFWR